MALTGGAVVWRATTNLPIGTLANIGPGAFPLALGVLLAVCGSLTMLKGWHEAARMPRIELRALSAVLGSGVAFVLLLPLFGLLPATAVAAFVCTQAVTGTRVRQSVIFAVCACLFACALFWLPLGFVATLGRWPL